ncbi:helix-turn-helix transcriptional regulator [Xanthobacter sediminis]
MQDKTDSNWPRFVRTPEAARLLDLSPRTLEKHRCDGTGPIYHKLGGRVVYAVSDLQAWIEASARQSTSEAVTGTRAPHELATGHPASSAR